ncbi:MAG: hypothetical protein WAK61_00440 [Leclercia sp.]
MSDIKKLEDLLSIETSENNNRVIVINVGYACPFGLKKFLTKDSDIIAPDDFNPDICSSYKDKDQFKTKDYLKTSNWASNAGVFSRKFRLLHSELAKHITFLFHAIEEAYHTTWDFNAPVLCRNNLFHGHVIHNPVLNDILIVFHAFEYPDNLDLVIKSNQAQEIEPGVPAFKKEALAFKWRNAIYSVNKNRIYLPDASRTLNDPPLIDRFSGAWTLDEKKCGQGLFDVNYFPRESVPLFAS